MRFPLGLTADLSIGRARQTLRGSVSHPLILQFPVLAGSSNSVTPLPSCDCLSAVCASSAPVVWINGPEPLLHPEIGRLARRIVDTGRHVFVVTNGELLRRRIHEFRPVSRLFLTAQFNGLEECHDLRASRDGAFREVLDGIRAAKLSGFLVCAHVTLCAGTEIAKLVKVREVFASQDVDGLIVSLGHDRAKAEYAGSEHPAMQRRLSEARTQMPSRRWKWFSQLLDESLLAAKAQPTAKREPDGLGASDAHAREESVEVS